MNDEQIQIKFDNINESLAEIRKVIDADKEALIKRIEELEKRIGQQKSE